MGLLHESSVRKRSGLPVTVRDDVGDAGRKVGGGIVGRKLAGTDIIKEFADDLLYKSIRRVLVP